jgi:PPK2 family polyphosphate:nucleotide phosphotransferase
LDIKKFQAYRVRPSSQPRLRDLDPAARDAFSGDRDDAHKELAALSEKLVRLQELLYAGHRHKLLVVLQGMDTAGKDGVIRRVFQGVNPQGVRVASFRAPTAEELDRDFLWRVHRAVPGRGELAIFNRSHYEDVLVVRVHGLVPPEVWKSRYESIVAFETMLHREGTTILKFFLHISRDEQKERLQARLDDPAKRWKFNPADLPERALWSEYEKAYEEAIARTSTDQAPWYIVPSDRKWHRDLAVSALLVEALEGLRMDYPKPAFDPAKIVIP